MTRRSTVIAERMGEAQADRLSVLVGGLRITVPDNLTSTAHNAGRLRSKVGDELFALLVFHFAGTFLYVPRNQGKGPNVTAAEDREIERLTLAGWTAPNIAREIGRCTRTIYAKRAILRSRARVNVSTSGEQKGSSDHD